MNTKTLLASLAGAMLLASPVVASAATTAKTVTTTTTKDTCKNLKGDALKSCKDAQKKAAKTK